MGLRSSFQNLEIRLNFNSQHREEAEKDTHSVAHPLLR